METKRFEATSEGHIRRVLYTKSETYQIILERPRDPLTGKRRQLIENVTGTLKTAVKRRNDMQYELRKALELGVEPTKLTVNDVMQKYLTEIAIHLESKSRDNIAGHINGRLKTEFGHYVLGELKTDHIQQAVNRWKVGGKMQPIRFGPAREAAGGLSLRTMKANVNTLKTVLNHCINVWTDYGLTKNVAKHVTFPDKTHAAPKRNALTWAQVDALFAACEAAQFENEYQKLMTRTVFRLMIFCGMRKGEIFGLSIDDIDFETDSLYVHQVIEKPKGEAARIKNKPKTKSSIRTICFDAETSAMLQTMCAQRAKDKLRLGADFDRHAKRLLFYKIDGSPEDPGNFNQFHERMMLAASITTHVTPHDLRHTHSTLCGEAGVGGEVIEDRLGHTGGGRGPGATSPMGHLYNHPSMIKDRDLQAKLMASYHGHQVKSKQQSA